MKWISQNPNRHLDIRSRVFVRGSGYVDGGKKGRKGKVGWVMGNRRGEEGRGEVGVHLYFILVPSDSSRFVAKYTILKDEQVDEGEYTFHTHPPSLFPLPLPLFSSPLLFSLICQK